MCQQGAQPVSAASALPTYEHQAVSVTRSGAGPAARPPAGSAAPCPGFPGTPLAAAAPCSPAVPANSPPSSPSSSPSSSSSSSSSALLPGVCAARPAAGAAAPGKKLPAPGSAAGAASSASESDASSAAAPAGGVCVFCSRQGTSKALPHHDLHDIKSACERLAQLVWPC